MKMDLVDQIMAYETGELDLEGTLNLFSDLISDGTCWRLQGSYGRMAKSLIDAGTIDTKGNIDWDYVYDVMEA